MKLLKVNERKYFIKDGRKKIGSIGLSSITGKWSVMPYSPYDMMISDAELHNDEHEAFDSFKQKAWTK